VSDVGTAWAVVAAALGAALLTTGGAFLLDRYKAGSAAETVDRNELMAACVDLISRAQKLSHRAGFLHETMITRSGLSEGMDIALHHRKPLDQLEIGDYFLVDLGPMLEAQARVWLSGDEDLITHAGGILFASAELMGKSTALPTDRRPSEGDTAKERMIKRARGLKSLERDPELEAARNQALRELGRACWQFGQVMRARLGVKDVEALFRAFPGFHGAPADDG
jgi:hypothetical protein